MRKLVFTTIVFLYGLCLGYAQDGRVFYYHNDEKIHLDKIEDTKVIHFNKAIESTKKDYILNRLKEFDYSIMEIHPFICKVSGNTDRLEKNSVISTAIKDEYITCISDMLKYKSDILWTSNVIIVRIPLETDLHHLLQNNRMPVVDFRQIGHNKQTYVIELDITKKNAIEYANQLMETESVVWAQPSFWRSIHKLNPYYTSQWGLKNTGQYNGVSGIDINVTPAWDIATGTGIKVAVIDNGIDLTHPDLINNLLSGYDATDATYGGNDGGYGGSGCYADTHGTACAGIIAGVDNNIGIKGVAFNSKIIPVRIWYHYLVDKGTCYHYMMVHDEWIADGIYKAWHDYGADILSNSWGSFSPSHAINEAVMDALCHGRNSLGCVVVFGSGNSDEPQVLYPSRDIPESLTVGAINPCGERKSPTSCDTETNWGSDYGKDLNIMAPGVLIATTDVQGDEGYNSKIPLHTKSGGNKITSDFPDGDYTVWFNGTSAACPHVAGVAALILSVNPTLTGQQVRDIIESTAQKVRPDLYNYQDTVGRPNGKWHREMGYGLVNAYAAVLAASEPCYTGFPVVRGTIAYDTIWDAGVHIVDTIIVQSGATLTITSTAKFNNQSSIVVHPGGKLVIDGGKLTAACPDQLWQGIVVLGNRYQSQLPQYQGTVELKNGAIIEHALCAISAAPASYDNIFTGSRGGGIIQADSAIFHNNLQAIEYRQYEYQISPGNIADNVGKFTNCTFTINDGSRFSANGKTFRNHVTLWAVRGIIFEGCRFDDMADIPHPWMLPTYPKQGIYALDAGFKIINRCKSGGSTGRDCPCLPTHTKPTTFFNLNVGVRSENTGVSRSIYMDQSKFQRLGIGASMNVQANYRLTRCNFIDVSTGLNSDNSSGYKVEENSFSTTGNFAISATGISMGNSGNVENRIYKNYFNDLAKGISANGTNGNQLSGLQFISNEFTNHQYDIYISQNATVRASQGNSSTGACNKFIMTDISSIYSPNPLTAQHIDYYTIGGSCTPKNPTSNITISNVRSCNTTSTLCITSPRSDLDSLAQYQAMQQQYDQLLANLGENPEILQQLLVLSDAMRELSDNAISGILHDSILYVDALKSWYEVVRTPIAKYWLAEVYASESNYEQSEVILRAIPPMFDFSEPELIEHDNYMQFHHFKKQMLLSGRNWTLLDESEIAQLQRIAEATKGRSSGMAKGALCFFFDICYEDEFEGEGQGEEEKAEGKKAEGKKAEGNDLRYELSIFPNPTPSEMMVSLNNPAVKIVRMEVYDMTSRKVHQQIVNQSSDTLRLNELERGVYILKVYLDQGDMVVRKVVKQ